MSFSAPFPLDDAIADKSGRITKGWIYWLTELVTALNATSAKLNHVALSMQTATIGVTSIPTGALDAGLYRVDWYARVTQAAQNSSSLTVTIGFTDGGQTTSISGPAMTGNTPATVQTEDLVIRIDANTPITYMTTYASSGSPVMAYALDIILTQMAA